MNWMHHQKVGEEQVNSPEAREAQSRNGHSGPQVHSSPGMLRMSSYTNSGHKSQSRLQLMTTRH